MLQFASANLSLFPAMMESVFNSIGSLNEPPLVVDTGASCCISPCRSDFIDRQDDSAASASKELRRYYSLSSYSSSQSSKISRILESILSDVKETKVMSDGCRISATLRLRRWKLEAKVEGT